MAQTGSSKGKADANVIPEQGMPQPFLPKFKSGTENRFPLPTMIGVWEERGRSHLGILGESLDVPSTEHRIHSIPDPWARALLFDRALYSENHLLHETVLNEWKGLLAMLALREQRGYQGLTAREVVFDPAAMREGTFPDVLTHLLPSDDNLISADTPWQRLYTLRWQRQPFRSNKARAFAMTSPATLVCTGADYRRVLSEAEVPWFKDGLLRDPKLYLGGREKRALASWILALSRQMSEAGRRSVRSNLIIARLNAFATGLDPAAAELESFGVIPLSLNFGLYRALDRACAPETEVVSDVEIVGKKDAPRYLLIDPALAAYWNENANEITIYGNITLATASRLTSSGKTLDSLGNGIYWCTPEHLFADRLIYDSQPDAAFPGCMSVKFAGHQPRRNVVLPLHPDMLKLFTPADIAERMTIEWLPNGGATCRFKLMLRAGGKERSFEIQRTYSESEMTSLSNLPMVCIWPDFRVADVQVKDGGQSKSWKSYYTFELWPTEKDELTVKPWSSENVEPAAHRKHELDDSRLQVYLSESYPEALICETPYFSQAHDRWRQARGILLVQTPPLSQPPHVASAIVGIDFGSTGSNVYVRVGSEGPKPVVFKSRVKQITAFDATKFTDLCRALFVPNREWAAESILSIYQDFGDPPEGDRLAFRDGHVLYADDPRKLFSGDRRRVRSNLKWGTERERIAALDFLMQIGLQAGAEMAAEGLREVKVRFSYPTAFSTRDLNLFQAHWQSVTRRVRELSGVNLQLNAEVDNREAVVATRFFSDYTGNGDSLDISGGAVTLDIGGGTTDFAIWRKGGLQAHSSVILAGRDIFLAPIRRKPEILNELMGDMAAQIALDKLLGKDRDAAFDAQLDAIMSKYGEKMIESLAVRQARLSVQGFLSILEVGLCGLMFYAGLLLRRLIEGGKFKPGRRLALFVGGNGSKMFRWCSLGVDLSASEIHQRAAQAFLAGADLKDLKEPKIEIHLSAKPKAEVAYGLVCDTFEFDKDASPDFAAPMAGEKFLSGETSQDWKGMPQVSDIRERRVAVDRSFPMFTSFLASIDQTIDEDTLDMLDRIGGYVDMRLAKQAQDIAEAQRQGVKAKPEDLLRNEPIFIMALKRYLEMKTDDWARTF